MRRLPPFLIALTITLPPSAAAQTWSLEQNKPNPFCYETRIGFSIVEEARAVLTVQSPPLCTAPASQSPMDVPLPVVTLLDAVLRPGQYSILWNGRNEAGQRLFGNLAYTLTVGENPVLFTDTKTLTIECEFDSTSFSISDAPDPFCAGNLMSFDLCLGLTRHATLAVLSPDSSQVVRTLAAGTFSAGQHQLIWNGDDDGGMPLPDGAYPYRLTLRESAGGPVRAEVTQMLHIDCVVPTRTTTWAKLKLRYR